MAKPHLIPASTKLLRRSSIAFSTAHACSRYNKPHVLKSLLFCVLPAALAAQTLPPPFETPAVNNPPIVIPRPDGAKLSVPAGFTVEEYATGGFQRPRFMVEGP